MVECVSLTRAGRCCFHTLDDWHNSRLRLHVYVLLLSCRSAASSALDEHDTANSADGGFAEQLDHVDEASSRPQQASSRAVSRQLSSAATAGGQLRHVAPAREESGTFGASKIVSSVAADQTKIKRGGYMVSPPALVARQLMVVWLWG